MTTSKKIKLFLAIVAAILVYDNFSKVNIYSYNTVSTLFGTNSDITDGALSQLTGRSYHFEFTDGTTFNTGNGPRDVVLKQRAEISYGIASFVPFYKSMTPTMTFDCFIAHTGKYIGKIELQKQITISGFFNRSNMKKLIRTDYLNEATKMLDRKYTAYNELMSGRPFHADGNESSASVSEAKLMAGLIDPTEGFYRKIPIRDKGDVYTDTIHFKSEQYPADYPLYEVYKVDKPNKTITYSSYNARAKSLFSKKFMLEKVTEDEHRFSSFFADVEGTVLQPATQIP